MEYIALIKKDSFDCLFKYGRTHLNIGDSICIANHIDEYKNDTSLLIELFKERDDFEMPFEYVLINYVTDEEDSKSTVRIENVLGLYALDEQSVSSLSVRLDPRIVVNPPLWPNAINEIKMSKSVESCKRGIDNVWKIFRLDESDKQKCSAIITDAIINEVVRENYDNEQPSGDLSIWVYLLRYQRHEMYPQNDMGYFLDTVHAFTNWHFKDSNQFNTEATDVFKSLIDYKNKKSYSDILSYIKTAPEILNFREKAGIDGFYKIAPLYLKLLEPFAEKGLDLNGDIGGVPLNLQIEKLKNFGFNFSMAAYLLGIILGYDRTSDALYDSLELSIFKKEEDREVPSSHTEDNVDNKKVDERDSAIEEPENVGDTCKHPERSKRMATSKDSLTLDTIGNFDYSYPLIINIKNGKSTSNRTVTSYQELQKVIASKKDKEWRIRKK
jgi:hypothetical protein